MILIMFILGFISILIPLRIEIKDRSPFFLLWLLNLIFVLLPLYINRLTYDEDTLQVSLLYFIVCNLLYVFSLFLFRNLQSRGRNRLRLEIFPVIGYKNTNKLVLVLIMMIVGVFIYKGISIDRFFSSTLEDKRSLGGVQILLLMLLSILSPFALFYFLKKEFKKAMSILIVFIIVLLYFRSRSLMSLMFLPIAYYLFFWVKKGKYYLLFFGFFTYLISQIIKVIRYQGALSEGLSFKTIYEQLPIIISSNFNIGNGDLSIAEFYIKIIEDFDNVNWTGQWLFFQKFFYFFIPYSEKIKTVEYLMWDYYFSFGSNGSMHPTLYGVTYADGGELGVFFFVFIAFIRVVVQKIIIKTKDVRVLGVVMYFILFCSRGSFYNSFILLFVTISILRIFDFLFLRKET